MTRVNVAVAFRDPSRDLYIYIYWLVGYWAERTCFAAKVKSLLFEMGKN